MTETISIKCNGDLLEFWIGEESSYSEIFDALRARLDSNASFYIGSGRTVVLYGKRFSDIQKRELRALFTNDYQFPKVVFSDEDSAEPAQENLPGDAENIFLAQTVRSGQLIKTTGDITIIGDVNAGAEIVAGGNVAVFGKLRGLVHAGAFGRQDVVIVANKLMANQIRICGKIAVLPKGHHAAEPELVKLSKDGKVVISTIN